MLFSNNIIIKLDSTDTKRKFDTRMEELCCGVRGIIAAASCYEGEGDGTIIMKETVTLLLPLDHMSLSHFEEIVSLAVYHVLYKYYLTLS